MWLGFPGVIMQSRTAAKKSAGHTKNKQHHNRKRKGRNYGPKRFEGGFGHSLDFPVLTGILTGYILHQKGCKLKYKNIE